MGHPTLPNLEPLIAAGIDPKTGLPIKAGSNTACGFKPANKTLLRILDEQDAINRYTWYNLPEGLTSQMIERLLYYKGQLIFFYSEIDDKFYVMPYALDGGIDFYGRFTRVHPIPVAAGTSDADKKRYQQQRDYLSTIKLKPLYDIKLDELTYDDLVSSCVIIRDYTEQLSQTSIPRQQLNDPLLDVMSDCIPFMRTALLNATGVQGMRVNSEDEQSNVLAASMSIDNAALNGQKYVPVVGAIDFQELTGGSVLNSEDFMRAMQSLDNYRLSLYGLDNGGLFQKNTHMLQSEQNLNAGKASLALQDGLICRQNACDIINSYTGLGIWCEVSEAAIGVDMTGDGLAVENQPEEKSYDTEETDDVQ